uniref:Ankyrin repeat-containing protein At5g02620 n=1 Tax=Anthurium amnicola TaxID=1678845 RepID=A0A1D1Y3N0_9ARAE
MILKVDFSAVYFVNTAGNSPLHLCARKGNVTTFDDIVNCCPDSVDLADGNGKNVLHIAIENVKAELVRHILGKKSLAELINHRDNDGNTPLHTAAAKQDERCIFELLKKETLNRKLMNNEGQTAFDVLFIHEISRYSLTWYMAAQIMNSAFWRGDEIAIDHHLGKTFYLLAETVRPTRKENVEKLLVVATLVATVTFAAAFTLPGGYSNDGPSAGGAVLGMMPFFKAFLLTDTLAMLCSTLAVVTVVMDPRQSDKWLDLTDLLVRCSFILMGTAFGTGVYVVLAPDCMWLANGVLFLTLCLPLFTVFQFYYWAKKVFCRAVDLRPYVTEHLREEALCRMVTPTS